MDTFKHLPEPFRIRVVEPVKRTSREYREKAIVKAGMNPFLLDSDDVFIDLLTDSGTGSITQNMQAAMLRGDEAYSGSPAITPWTTPLRKFSGINTPSRPIRAVVLSRFTFRC